MKAVAVLAHKMDANANLDSESQARLEQVIVLHKASPFDLFLTSGWNYRKDCTDAIGTVMAKALQTSYGIESNKIIVDINARDTVGDAYFLRQNVIKPMHISNLVIVTSDYHVERTGLIFRSFFPVGLELNVIGAASDSLRKESVLINEKKSSLAFQQTFADVDLSNDVEIYRTLRSKHPFYNGQTFDQLPCIDPFTKNDNLPN